MGFTWLWTDHEKKVYSLFKSTISCAVNLLITFSCWKKLLVCRVNSLHGFYNFSINFERPVNVRITVAVAQEPRFPRIIIGHDSALHGGFGQAQVMLAVTLR